MGRFRVCRGFGYIGLIQGRGARLWATAGVIFGTG